MPPRTRVFALLCALLPPAIAWHAFMGQEAVPTLPGTNLIASLVLPSTPFMATELAPDNCSIAITSFQKLETEDICQYGQKNCSLPCATAWESFLRDFQSAAQNSHDAVCKQLLLELSSWPGAPNISYTPVNWPNIEGSLSVQCQSNAFSCPAQYCTLSFMSPLSCTYSTQLLQPLDCQTFTATDGVYRTPFLTWAAMAYYQRRGLGAAGGMDLVADDEHGTWACMYAPECGLTVADLSCFRYSQVRGEFNFWAYNSQLSLMPSVLLVNLSFCSNPYTLQQALHLTSANNASALPVVDVSFTWGDQYLNGQVAESGALTNLGPHGCEFFQLVSNRSWILSLYTAGYYMWTGQYYISEDNQTVAVGLQPVIASTMGTSLRMVLNWPQQPADYDLWMVLPGGADTWQASFSLSDSQTAVFWQVPNAAATASCSNAHGPCAQASITYGTDVTNGYGPEAIAVDGKLIPGTYGVFVNLHTDVPSESSNRYEYISTDDKSTTPFLDVYSESAQGLVLTLSPSSNTTVAAGGQAQTWWHALNLVVPAAATSTIDQCVSIQVVDQFVAGSSTLILPKDTLGQATGSVTPGTRVVANMNLYCLSNISAVFGSRTVLFNVVSATGGADAPVPGVRVRVTPQPSGATAARHLTPAFTATLDNIKAAGGRELIYGTYIISIDAPLFISLNQSFAVSPDPASELQTFFMLPSSPTQDTTAYAVLRWPQTPTSLDLYIMPFGMDPSWVDALQEPVGDPASVARAYAGGDASRISFFNAQTKVSESFITLERYQAAHGGGAVDGPQVMSVRSPLPGQYRVLVAIPPLAECPIPNQPAANGDVDPVFSLEDDIQLDVYIANALAATLPLRSQGGKWWYAGYIFVPESVTPGAAAAQWIAVDQILLDDPRTQFYSTVQLSLTDSVSFTAATDYTAARYTMYLNGLCECALGGAVCNCFGYILSSGIVGPSSVPCSEESCPEETWFQDSTSAVYVPRASNVYRLKVTLDGYFDRYVDVDAYMDVVVRVVMVPLTPAGELRAVLTWGPVPLDLDLWMVPVGDISSYTYWDSQGPNDGVRLDRDATEGYGPEVITMTSESAAGVYRLAVNVYSSNNNPDASCVGMDHCEFSGGETVEIFVGSALIDRAVFNRTVAAGGGAGSVVISSSWWLVTEIQVSQAPAAPGGRAYAVLSGTGNEVITCGNLMTDPAGACRGSYCCNGCTSNCGACNEACAPEVQLLLALTDAIAFGPSSDFTDVVYIFYPEGACQCPPAGLNCTCAGDALAAGILGPDLTPCRQPTALSPTGSCPDSEWNSVIRVTQQSGVYWSLLLRQSHYLDHVINVSISDDSSEHVTLVPLPPAGNLTIVLTWGSTPLDLDLWLIPASRANYTYWDSRGPHDGVFLDRDAREGYGPETISLWSTASLPRAHQNDTYTVAVNVYSANGDDTCLGADVCRFAGGENVAFVDAGGVQASFSVPENPTDSDGSWWAVATVRRSGAAFVIQRAVATIPQTTCEFLLKPPTARTCDARGYCCDGCTSHCRASCTCA